MKDNNIKDKLELIKKQIYQELRVLKSQIKDTNCNLYPCNIKLIRHKKSFRRFRNAYTYRNFKKVSE